MSPYILHSSTTSGINIPEPPGGCHFQRNFWETVASRLTTVELVASRQIAHEVVHVHGTSTYYIPKNNTRRDRSQPGGV
jgi:hypothetical protein